MTRLVATLAVAICLCGHRAYGQQFDDAAFCKSMQEFAVKANKDAGSMLDANTRNDGLAVLCAEKVIDFKKFLIAPSYMMRPGWKDRKSKQWRDIYCKDPYSKLAIQNGWTIATTMTTTDGDRSWITADCQ